MSWILPEFEDLKTLLLKSKNKNGYYISDLFIMSDNTNYWSSTKDPELKNKLPNSAFGIDFADGLKYFLSKGVVRCMVKVGKQIAINANESLQPLIDAKVSSLKPDGELAKIFTIISDNTEIQRVNKEKEIIGKVVLWNLNVYEISKKGKYYLIQTESADSVGTFIELYPQNEKEEEYIEKLKTGSKIKIKGIITGTEMRNISISPAILVK